MKIESKKKLEECCSWKEKRKMCFVKHFSSKTWHFPFRPLSLICVSSFYFFNHFFFSIFNGHLLFIRNQVNDASFAPVSFLFLWALIQAKILSHLISVLWLALPQKIHHSYDLSFISNPRTTPTSVNSGPGSVSHSFRPNPHQKFQHLSQTLNLFLPPIVV